MIITRQGNSQKRIVGPARRSALLAVYCTADKAVEQNPHQDASKKDVHG
jgi:hypothetical protein